VSYPPLKQTPSIEDVQMLRNKLAASRNVSRALQKEHAKNEAVLRQLRSMVAPSGDGDNDDNLSFLANATTKQHLHATQKADSQPLTSSTNFAVSQLPALKALLSDLRPRLAALHNASTIIESAKDEVREERRGYIEQRIRSHLARNGTNLQDNSAAFVGTAADPEEIQAMETAASIFDPV
jgi:kinetochore protein Mis12/MTW1